MYKVVLIDDEPLVIEGLLSMVQWHTYGFKVSGVAGDGEEGYRLIEAIQPDLVITDISMPGMDGLKLMDTCRKQLQYPIQFTILSGYNDFDYIRKALSLKSLSYLLKPIDIDEIHQLLATVKERNLEKEKELEQTNKRIELVLRTSLKRLLDGEHKETLINRIKFILNMTPQIKVQYVLLEVVAKGLKERLEEQIVMAYFDLFQSQKEYVDKSDGVSWHFVRLNNHMIELLGVGMNLTDVMANQSIQAFIQLLKEDRMDVRTYSSSLSEEIKNVPNLYHEAKYCRKVGFYENASLVYYEQIKGIKLSRELTFIDIPTLMTKIKNGASAELEYYIQKLFADIQEHYIDPSLLRDCFADVFNELNDQTNVDFQIRTLCELKKALLTFGTMLQESNPISNQEDVIESIKSHIKQNYAKNIKLKEVAGLMNFNPVYMGQLFQKREGCKYNDYVLHVRISKAKELLLYTDLNITQVSDRVGFNNADYFVLKFKELEGVSPTTYRYKK